MKRTELKRKTPLRARSALPTRKPARKVAATKPAAVKRHLDRVAKMPCIICRRHGPSTVHHVRHKVSRSGTFARDDRRVVPLCPAHHLHDHGPDSVERLHEKGIWQKFGIDLWAEAEGLWHGSVAWENGVDANR